MFCHISMKKIFTKEDTNHKPTMGDSPYISMSDIVILVAGVEKLLKNLNPKKVIGSDQLPIRMLKENVTCWLPYSPDCLVLDLSKAFDTIAHQRLLHKLNYYGLRGRTLQWINSWLTAHRQSVVVDGDTSDEVHVASGIPQGTVLCPILFLLYINDLGRGVNFIIKLFADDCILVRQINTETDSITL